MAFIRYNMIQFIDEIKSIVIQPEYFFSTITKENGFIDSILKVLAYSFIYGVLTIFWDSFSIFNESGLLTGIISAEGNLWGLIKVIIVSILLLLIGSTILLAISTIFHGITDLELNLKIISSIMFILPLSSLFGFLTFLPLLSKLLNLIFIFYGLWLLYLALSKTLNCSNNLIKIMLMVIVLIVLLIFFSPLFCDKAEKTDENFQKLSDDFKKAVQE